MGNSWVEREVERGIGKEWSSDTAHGRPKLSPLKCLGTSQAVSMLHLQLRSRPRLFHRLPSIQQNNFFRSRMNETQEQKAHCKLCTNNDTIHSKQVHHLQGFPCWNAGLADFTHLQLSSFRLRTNSTNCALLFWPTVFSALQHLEGRFFWFWVIVRSRNFT